jgi:putative addiction module killer protein
MTKATSKKTVLFYQDRHGAEPFTKWLLGLKDGTTRRRILTRLRRLEQGNFGDCKPVGDGVSELRLFFGSGYRVYFGEDMETIVIILNGGNKARQNSDIKLAKSYWKEYLDHDET